jgi:DNA recombination protein RmuC
MDPVVYLILGVAAGMAVGVVAAWLVVRSRDSARRAEAEQIESRTEDLNQRVMDLTGELRAQETLAGRIPQLEEQLLAVGVQLGEKAEALARLETTLEEQRKGAQEKQALLDEAKEKLTDAFKALSADALKQNNQSFLTLASENLKQQHKVAQGDLEQRRQAVGELVGPLREQLGRYEKLVQSMEGERKEAYGKLLQQVIGLGETEKDLMRETGNLVRALRQPQVRGAWGELTLKRVVELAGMVEHCDFVEQESHQTDQGRLRPDMIINLPAGRRIVIDVKTPMLAYLDFLEASDEAARKVALVRHTSHVKNHMDQLAGKNYTDQLPQATEFVVMFIPNESFLGAAVEQDKDLIERGFEKGVILAAPTTLISLLRTVAMGWRQVQLAENAERISELGKELYDRLATMTEHLTKIGSSLESSVKHYNKAMASMEQRVLKTAHKFTELGVSPKKELPELIQIETTPTRLDAPESLPLFESTETLDQSDPRA